MCHVSQADVTLLNSGTLRSDTLHAAGEFKMKVRDLFCDLQSTISFCACSIYRSFTVSVAVFVGGQPA